MTILVFFLTLHIKTVIIDTPNARLYFTTNGKNPNPWKRKVDGREVTFVYKAPFALRPGKRVVKAIAVHR